MSIKILLYILLALLCSISIAAFQYFFSVKKRHKINILLFILKVLSLFFIGLLLTNPKIKNTKTENIKPVLSVLVDNSLSVKYFNEEKIVGDWLQKIRSNKRLQNKFDIDFYAFGENMQALDSLSHSEAQTDIAKAIKTVNSLEKDKLGAILLVSDGNQTIGNDYEFVRSKKKIFPVVIGDTTKYQDVKISQLNVNKYSYIKNKFPVEILLFYDGEKEVNSVFSIAQNGKKIFSKKLSFSKERNTQTITANLTSTKEGLQYYSAKISALENEKNIKNNYKNFSIEVINEQTKVLILSSILHPDLGVLKKAIESNKQRKVNVNLMLSNFFDLNDNQLVVFYQPNNYFNKFFKQRKSNYLIITGAKTDWKFLNSQQLGVQKKVINQSENYRAIYNPNFLTFLQDDINFNKFPPLKDKFGDVIFQAENQSLLYQKIAGISTKQPLLSTFEKGDQKSAILFGEGIWKWRSANYVNEQSFEQFDTFIGNLVQYLSSTKKRKRLEVNAERLYPANANISISALYLDKNYQFDNRASLQIMVTNQQTKVKKTVPMSLVNSTYKVRIEGLSAGDYHYKVSVAGQNVNAYGKFKVENYQVEEQFTNANTEKLQKLAAKTEGELFYKNQQDEVFQKLISDTNYFTIQKLTTKEESLINLKWMLLIIVSLLALEWFIRKYHGKI